MAAVPGSLFRRVLFWAHLTCGIAAGLFIFIMSASGVLLTYEHQLVEHAASANRVTAPSGASPLEADGLALAADGALPGSGRINLVFDVDPAQPVTATRGRDGSVLLDPYTGAVIADASQGERRFFRLVENWHRWLGGEPRGTGATLIDYGNLLFAFILLSGIYIWVPQVMRWRNWRGLMFFQRRYINAKVRDFNWHHVFSFWMLIPLLVISGSGVVISFDWANRLLFAAYGEEPARRGPSGPPGPGGAAAGGREAGPSPLATLEALRIAAATSIPDWQRLTIPARVTGPEVEITAELRSTARRAPRRTVTLRAADASVVKVSPVLDATPQTAGQRARTWVRFAHTGEQYGVVGQTIAGIASLAACFLVYTGLALAWRRLVRPLLRRREAAS